jgi:uncharacterized protein
MGVHRLDRTEAKRIAVRAQLLDAARPSELLTVVQRLTLLQVDPTAAIAPNADLVAWSRLGSSYDPVELTRALEQERTLFELDALVRPMDDLPLYRADMANWPPWPKSRHWLEQNDGFRRDILELLARSGPLPSREIPDTSRVAWPSTGWTNARNVTQMLEFLLMRGEAAISSRRGRDRLWDLAERVYPSELLAAPVIPVDEARRTRDERRLRALGVAREGDLAVPKDAVTVGDAGDAAVVDGVPGTWRVDPAALDQPFTGRTALLSPFDRLIYDRARTLQLFEFDYVLEMYKPKEKRRWGYFALSILHDDRLIGKVDAIADRKAGAFRVDAVHQDVPFTPSMTDGVDAELADLAGWLQLALVRADHVAR